MLLIKYVSIIFPFHTVAPSSYTDYGPKRNNTLPKLTAKSHCVDIKQQPHMHRLTPNGVFAQSAASGSRQQHSLPPSSSSHQSQHQHQQSQPNAPRKSGKRNGELSTANLRQILNNLNIFGSSSSKQQSSNQNNGILGSPSSSSSNHQHTQTTGNHLQPFSHSSNGLSSSMNSHHSRCSESSLQSKRSNRMSMHRSRSRTRASDTDTNSMKSHRRPSVDTVSTYLSHESKESLRSRNFAISVNDLLDCSLGSDEVFVPSLPPSSTSSLITERAPAPPPIPTSGSVCTGVVASGTPSSSQQQSIAGSIVGVDPASDMISRFVKVVEPPQWPNAQPCPMCMEELVHNAQNPAIALSRCQHLMHLQCLNGMIIAQQNDLNKVSMSAVLRMKTL